MADPTSSPTSAPPAAVREDMVATAVKFLQNPRVQSTSVARQRAFLLDKGLTTAEVDAALAAVPSAGASAASAAAPAPAPSPPSSSSSSWSSTLFSVLVGGGSLFAAAKAYQSAVHRHDHLQGRVHKCEADLAVLAAAVPTTVQLAQEQPAAALAALAARVGRIEEGSAAREHAALADIRAELANLKAILLSRNSFPSVTPSPTIPAWQKAHLLRPRPHTEAGKEASSPAPAPSANKAEDPAAPAPAAEATEPGDPATDGSSDSPPPLAEANSTPCVGPTPSSSSMPAPSGATDPAPPAPRLDE